MSDNGMKMAAEDCEPGDIEAQSGTAPNERPKAPGAERADELGHMKLRLEERSRESEEYKNEAARARADFYNYRTRVERDRARDRVLAAEGAVDALLPVLDNLERTLRAVQDKESPLYKGVAMVQKQFFSALQNLGLQVIDTSGRFDPSKHEALMVTDVNDELEDGLVIEELHRGYILGEKVLRAAGVRISRKA
ncbi:MAG: nucleotide exchange factor GrpE [Synergistaceae bacterium]|jgi:molecular chaperone GrpE|nr:nucleotide exchange factor GrpE [Synergistaceae bacterium]